MGRAPNPGGPQRVTAHVVPRAKPFSDSEEEEKTTIESQWEDEASTTVEQGDVAEKIRSLGVEPRRGGTNVTSTGAGALDEPTVDDQHAQLSAITPVRDVARLQITAGNDAGTEVEIRPGKTYTIGRAIDNDVVLTDIAVSRKHFDLRFEDGAWVIVDRGSGNGTVVNGNLEDNPFMLANGDVIEIGNTIFRFDQPNAASRINPNRTVDLDPDDEELSTVAGKPLRTDPVELAEPMPIAMSRPPRPKTLPPPTPLRTASSTQPPPLGFPPPGPAPMPQPSTTLPMAQMANRAPIGGPLPSLPGVPPPQAPAMLGDQRGMPLGAQMLPTTLPGQGLPQQRPAYGYPQATEIPPHSVHAQMLLIQTQNRRGDHSTAHVPPTPYDGMQIPRAYSQPQLTKRAKLVLAGIGLAVFAAVMTVAIVKSGNSKAKAIAGEKKTDGKSEAKVAAKAAPSVEEIKTETPKVVPPPQPTVVKTEAPKTVVPPPAPPPQPTVVKTEPKTVAPPAPPPTVAKTETIKETPKAPKETPKESPKETPKPKVAKTEPKERPRPRNTERKVEARRPDPTPPEAPKAKNGGNPDGAIAEAEKLYRQKKFAEASSYLSSQAKKFDEEIARDMRKTAEYYAKLGKALSTGTAPATRPTVAYEALRSAQNYDRNLSNEYDGEIQTKLSQVAPKAALSYIAQKNYSAARNAMLFAQKFANASETVALVKSKLESAAGDLYSEAIEEMSESPQAAKDKLKLIMQITDPGSTWYKKATQKLSGG